MEQEEKIRGLVSPAITGFGYRLVRVQISGENDKTLQIMVERVDEVSITVEDCAIISREVSRILDVDDPINGSYLLEVSSPGIDRPLVCIEDFDQYVGFEARVDMNILIEGRKKFKGILLGVQNDKVKIKVNEEIYTLPFDAIRRAKLLLSQELLNTVV
jgi:ribosome maturation factor RimP